MPKLFNPEVLQQAFTIIVLTFLFEIDLNFFEFWNTFLDFMLIKYTVEIYKFHLSYVAFISAAFPIKFQVPLDLMETFLNLKYMEFSQMPSNTKS